MGYWLYLMVFIHFTNFTFHLQITAVCSHKEYLSNTAKTSKEKSSSGETKKKKKIASAFRCGLFWRFVSQKNSYVSLHRVIDKT